MTHEGWRSGPRQPAAPCLLVLPIRSAQHCNIGLQARHVTTKSMQYFPELLAAMQGGTQLLLQLHTTQPIGVLCLVLV